MKIEIITYDDDNIEKYKDIKYYCSECGFQVLRDELLRPYVRYKLVDKHINALDFHKKENQYVHVNEIRGRACISCINQMKNKEYNK